jgi:hypothetical protein
MESSNATNGGGARRKRFSASSYLGLDCVPRHSRSLRWERMEATPPIGSPAGRHKPYCFARILMFARRKGCASRNTLTQFYIILSMSAYLIATAQVPFDNEA